MMMNDEEELWGIRWNEERVGKSKCKTGAEEAATEIDRWWW
jgi:hypothetical protein